MKFYMPINSGVPKEERELIRDSFSTEFGLRVGMDENNHRLII